MMRLSKAEAFVYFQMQLLVFKRGVLPSVVMRIIRRIMLFKILITSPCLKHLRDHSAWVRAVTWSADEQFLASGSNDNSVKIYKGGGDFPLLKTLTHHAGWVFALAFSRNGSLLASGGGDTRLVVVDLAKDFKMVANLNNRACGAVYALCFAPNSLWLLSGYMDGTIIKYAVNSNFAVVQTVKPHINAVSTLSFNADGDMLASCSYETINVYTASDLKIVKTLTDHTDYVFAVSLSGDGRWLASASDECHVMVYDVKKDFALVKKIITRTDEVSSLCFTSNSRVMMTSGGDYDEDADEDAGGSIKVYDCSDDFALIQSLDGAHDGPVRSLSISGKYLASGSSGSSDWTVKVWTLDYKS
jgi:WD40 repeat protein